MVDKRRHKRVKVKLNLVVSNIFDQNADILKLTRLLKSRMFQDRVSVLLQKAFFQ